MHHAWAGSEPVRLGAEGGEQAEAANASVFAAGWRPLISWVCGIAFAYHTILQLLLAFGFAAYGVNVPLPQFDMDGLSKVLGEMSGLGTMRTVEKVVVTIRQLPGG